MRGTAWRRWNHTGSCHVAVLAMWVLDTSLVHAQSLKCTLNDIFLRSTADGNGNAQPIDISVVPGTSNKFTGYMDYAMNGFAVEAVATPADLCTVQGLPSTATMLDPGEFRTVPIQAAGKQDDSLTTDYMVNVSRFTGAETTLKAVRIQGAYLVPGWNPNVFNYTAYLGVEYDVAQATFLPLDTGQAIGLVADLEVPATPDRRLADVDGLQTPIGEVQHAPANYETTLDIGHQRHLDLVVTSADGSAQKRYRFSVKRPWCPAERRFFDGMTKSCTDICNEGYFGNPDTGRCTTCPDPNCAVCDGSHGPWCTLCLEGFTLAQGKCVSQAGGAGIGLRAAQAQIGSYTSKHRLLAIGGGVVVFIALCSCLAYACRGSSSRSRNKRLLDDLDDEELATSMDIYSTYNYGE